MAVGCAIIGPGNIGIDGFRQLECYPGIGLAFDATSAKAPEMHDRVLRADGKKVIDLTPAAVRPIRSSSSTATRRSMRRTSAW